LSENNIFITFEEALDILSESAIALSDISCKEETVSIENALGRILSENILADRDYPPFNRSAMDGFAINFADWQEGIRGFVIAEVIFAGQTAAKLLSRGQCYKIMTGAAVPPAANCVVRREDTTQTADRVNINAEELRSFQNIAKQGEDTKKGEIIVTAPVYCTPAIISTLATTGNAKVKVKKMPEVAVFTTGDEVVEAGAPVSSVQIRNSNQHLLKSMLQKWQIFPAVVQHLADDKAEIQQALEKAIHHDIIILSGGVSAGDADFVPEILKDLGVENLFYKVAIKPGKPIWCGKLPRGGMVFALPGNPFSCLVTFSLFVEGYLHQLIYKRKKIRYKFPVNASRIKKHKLTEFFPVEVATSPDFGVKPIPFNGSGDIRAGLFADGLAIHPHDATSLLKGDLVEFIPFK
jgi:molybdopterin molybdotransferase